MRKIDCTLESEIDSTFLILFKFEKMKISCFISILYVGFILNIRSKTQQSVLNLL